MSGFVYIVQPAGGGPIKIGQSGKPDVRQRSIRGLFPYGVDVLATMEGDRTTEGFIHCCFRPIATSQEWFRSEPAVWRFVLDVIDHGRPSYVPVRDDLDGAGMKRLAVAEFGSTAGALAVMGYAPTNGVADVFSDTPAGGGGIRARLAFALSLKRGELPDYISELHQRSALSVVREAAE